MKRIFILLLLLSGSLPGFSCLNVYYSVDQEGHFHETEPFRTGFNINFNSRLLEKRLIDTHDKLQNEGSYRVLSDYAVYLMKAGKLTEALELLIVLSAAYPGEYGLAANLGTAYELSGETDSALVYIRKAMELNPASHKGSEWVHIKVLETKLAQRSNPGFLASNTVLQLTPDQEKDSAVLHQLTIQVRERFPFCPGPDLIMANLLEDLGDCMANNVSIEYARVMYEIAMNYYGDTSTVLVGKIDRMKALSVAYSSAETTITREGENIKVGRIKYTAMLDNNNDPPYEIRWDKINCDVDSLLAMAGLSRPEPVSPGGVVLPVPVTESSPKMDTSLRKVSMTYILVTLIVVALMGAILVYIRRRYR